jgi:hypothetical protein
VSTSPTDSWRVIVTAGRRSLRGPARLVVVSSRGRAHVALHDPGVAALVAGGADLFRRFALDQLVQHQPHGITDRIDTFAGAERVQQLGHED